MFGARPISECGVALRHGGPSSFVAAGAGAVRAVAAAAIAIFCGMPAPSPAATINVTTTSQEVNGDANCSLQEAIFAANFRASLAIDPANPGGAPIDTGCAAGTGNDTIVLQAGALYQVGDAVADPFNFAGPTANPMVISTVVIEGNGARLERTGGQNIRAFVVGATAPGATVNGTAYAGNGNLTLRNLHVKGFRARGGDGGDGAGGALGAGGAIYNTQTLVIERSTFEGNTATGGNGGTVGAHGSGAGGGGGLGGNGGNGSIPELTVGGGGGGGARGNGGNGNLGGGGGGGTLTSGGSTALPPGTAGAGGGFDCGGKGADSPAGIAGDGLCAGGGGGGGAAALIGVDGVGTSGGLGGYGGGGGGGGSSSTGGAGGAGGFGGGGGAGAAALTDSRGGNGGEGGFGGGGAAAGIGPDGSLGLDGEAGTFGGESDENTGLGGGGGAGLGGAIFSDGGSVTVRNSTFYGNAVAGGLGGMSAQDGKARGTTMFIRNAGLTLLNSTISHGSGVLDILIYAENAPAGVVMRHTIVADNADGSNNCALTQFGTGAVTAEGNNNLIEVNGNLPCPGGLLLQNPQLGALQVNAPGNTPTQAIAKDSSAFNAGDASAQGNTCLATDQRGVGRPLYGVCDIGAYELSPTLDIDGEGTADALTDGLLMLRHLFGATGAALTAGAVAPGAPRSDTDIAQYLADLKPALDVDSNGTPDAMTDGLLVLRYLFGIRGPALVAAATGLGAVRTPEQIEAYIHALLP